MCKVIQNQKTGLGRFTAMATLLTTCVFTGSTLMAQPDIENFVVFFIDDFGVNHANFLQDGPPEFYLPTIDALAAQSLVFTNLHTTTPVCTPSRYAFLTANNTSRAQNTWFARRMEREGMAVPTFNVRVTADERTMPGLLQEAGYRTGFFGKDHISDVAKHDTIPKGLPLDYPEIDALFAEEEAQYTDSIQAMGFDEVASIYPNNPSQLPISDLRAHNLDWITAGTLDFLDANHDEKFFVFSSLTIPHVPMGPEQSWAADPRITPFGMLDEALEVQPPRNGLTARVTAAGYPDQENYLWLDDAVRVVVERLEALDVLEETAIVFLSDHGMQAKGTIMDAGTRTAGYIHYPGAVGTTDALATNIDISTTILDLAGIDTVDTDGTSLRPILEDIDATVRDDAYFELGYARAILRADGWKYIALRHSDFITERAATQEDPLSHWRGLRRIDTIERWASTPYPDYYDIDQIYDLNEDPNEQINRFDDAGLGGLRADLQNRLRRYVQDMPGSFGEFKPES